MRALISCVRVRVYQLLMLLPPKSYEHMFHPLLRELVAEVTLSDDQGSQLMTAVAGQLCSGAEHTLLAPWSGGATDQALVEDQLQTLSHMGSGALENDSTCLISGSAKDVHNLWPEPDTPQAACLDAAILAFGRVFPMIPDRQKLQIIEHFAEVIKNCKQAQRQQAILLNVLCTLALAFRAVTESRGGARIDSEPVRKASTALVESGLEPGPTPLVGAAAAEALGVVDETKKLPLPDTGLEGALFDMLDVETDPTLRSNVQETIISLVQATCGELLNQWLLLCKDILATSNDNTRSTMFVGEEKTGKDGDDDEEGPDDDDATLQVGGPRAGVPDKGKVQPRWPTRVFATQVVQRLMSVCDTERAHLDLSLAKELQMSSGGRADYLVLHLSDLVRMSFMGATSDNTELRLAGLNSLQDVITRFSTVPEPEFPGHVILEQFQAQVGAALRPAFTEDTPSHVTAAACQVCSTWIGSGVARDLNDLRRVHQLLVSSLGKLKHGSINTQLYSESAATLEKLSILKAWAEVYVTAIAQEEYLQNKKESTGDDEDMGYMNSSESLLSLVRPELDSLVCYWLAALRDSALLSLPAQFSDQLPATGGAFYKAESADACREYYRSSWPPILLALAIWLSKSNFELPENAEAPQTWPDNRRESRFHLMMGIAVEALCSRTTYADDHTIQSCVRAVHALLQCEWCQLQLMSDIRLPIELCNVLHR
ncbi:hypothetical protein OESDEN_13836 [Oesophagostomum dentatum]|uniref:HEAT repeat protein n=1 Tax=Oesophagostomum dentatum TaxID=61180 RepID=A0A0B1SM60_OESDE|nr:hypothetical protein OESDEN_13836 [Oesophagostomum dentatum]